MVYSSVLGARLVGLGNEKLKLYHASLNIPSPPSRATFALVQRDILIAAEEEARKCMDSAKLELENIFGLDTVSGG